MKYADIKLSLFSKDQCGLCDNAKFVMEKVTSLDEFKKIHYETVDINKTENKEWWDKYCFDIPVLHIENKNKQDSLIKVFHRLNEEDIIDKIKKLED